MTERSPRTPIAAAAGLLCAFACAPVNAAAAESWHEVKLPGEFFTLVTDAGEKEGVKVLFQLAQFDQSLKQRFPWIRLPQGADPHLLVFASPDPALVASLAPDPEPGAPRDPGSSYWASDWERTLTHVGAVRAGSKQPADAEPSPYRGYLKGRAAYLVGRSLDEATPAWLVRGLVSFLSDTWIKDKEMLAGRMMAQLKEAGTSPSPAADFFREGRGRDSKFDAQAGLFIHYLLVGEGGRNARTLDALFQSYSSREAAAAAAGALGRITSLYPGFAKHLSSKKFAALKLSLASSLTPAAFGVKPLPLADALLQRAAVYLTLNRPVDTRTVLRQVKLADPSLARPHEIEAFLLDAEQRTTESKQAIEAAIERGSQNPHLRYRLAQLQWGPKMTRAALEPVRALLEFAHQNLPTDFKVAAYLAEVESDLGLAEPALNHAQKAAANAPSDVYALMALARAQWNARQADPALATARRALDLAKLASQKDKVQEFVTFATRNKTAQAKGGKPWTTQFGPPPSGAFGATRAAGPGGRVNLGQARTDSADAAAITECFAQREDAACARAVPALEASCAERQATSCVSLGSLYEGGFGVPRDRRRAAGAYKTACGFGDKAGCGRFAFLEVMGLGVPQNEARGMKTLESLCAESIPEGCIGQAQVLRRTGFAVDRDHANRLLKSTCDAGSAEACALLSTR